MSFFSKLFGNHERQLEDMYVKMYVSDKGMPLSEARQAIRGFIQQAKEEGQKEGTTNLPPNFGDELLRQESSDEKIGAVLASIRKEGVTDEDIRWWWNMPDLERRLMLKEAEANRVALFIHYLKQYDEPEEAGVKVRKYFPIFGVPDATTSNLYPLSGDDAPLPHELKDRITRYSLRRIEQDEDSYKRDMETSSSYNALVRREIRNGNL